MSDTNPAAAPPSENNGRSSPGEYLRKLREEKGHTHATVSAALHLTVHYIKALEGDEYGKLPGLTFVKGYLRAYARFLGADVNTVLARFDEHITGLLDAGQHTARVERSKRRQDQALRWAIGAGLVVVAGVAAGWWFMHDAQPVDGATARQQLATQTQAPQTQAPVNLDDPFAAAANRNDFAPQPAPVQDAFTQPVTEFDTPAEADEFFAAALVAEENEFGAASDVPAEGFAPAAGAAAEQGELAVADASVTAEAAAANITASEASPEPAASGSRQISLIGIGDDELRLRLRGSSWIEVNDGSSVRLFSDMLAGGDSLTIRGQGPFRVVFGDAANVDVSLNAKPIDISADIRADRTARVVLGAAAAPAQTQTTEAPAASAPGAVTGTEVTQ
jgi:cytoskeleton protein RodZ